MIYQSSIRLAVHLLFIGDYYTIFNAQLTLC